MKDQVENKLHAALRGKLSPLPLPFTTKQGPGTRRVKGFRPSGVELIDSIVESSGAEIWHDEAGDPSVNYTPDDIDEEGFYVRSHISLPFPYQFESIAGYVAGIAHELTHWTAMRGKAERPAAGMNGMDRFLFEMGDPEAIEKLHAYAREEATAEIGAALLLDAVGQDADVPARAAYVAGWLDAIPEGARADALAHAEVEAERAASWLLGRVGLTLL